MKQPWQQQQQQMRQQQQQLQQQMQQQQQQQRQRMMQGYAWQQQQQAAGADVPRQRSCLGRLAQVFVILLAIALCGLVIYVALNFQGPSF
jgi:preprotein translocase subunit SecF